MTWSRLLSLPVFAFALQTLLSQTPVVNADKVGLKTNQIKNLVTFGDSYTDTVAISDGGRPWPDYVVQYTGINLSPFARSGATCSNNITYRPFPSLFESQLPDYFAAQRNGTVRHTPSETIYTLWIGTNDVGVSSLLTGSNGASIVDVATCMVNWVKVLYQQGARNFLFQNMLPLETTPLYAPYSWPNRYFNAPRNTSEWSVFMRELTLAGNALTQGSLQALAPTLHDAHIGIFDSHSLFADMYKNPKLYLNGTAPLNVTGAVQTCVYELDKPGSTCTTAQGSARDSFLWYDELHPSEQADRIVAREISEVIQGKSNKWTTWLS
ncbi:SGNH hydrolase [Pluteus cervinus]|uniref:SGNH hydrolase n=1 Tax=Pluteus cervinus TaxID=181527 RepID=A0ACD3AUD2_9AGAR|nr:SGNH hydrolase [Pluteus cervinus]